MIYLGADHGGFRLKEHLKTWFDEQGFEYQDLGADEHQPQDDYPQYAARVAQAVVKESEAVGILFCRSGGGMALAANKISGVRAVEVFNPVSAVHAKEHNNANIITIGADWMSLDKTKDTIEAFLQAEFSKEPRHQRRLQQIKALTA